jgi:hypothetical protein
VVVAQAVGVNGGVGAGAVDLEVFCVSRLRVLSRGVSAAVLGIS